MNRLKQKQLLKKITNRLGKVEVTDDKIICYVSKNKSRKSDTLTFGHLTLLDIYLSDNEKYDKSILDEYEINKPIYYVFDNINFTKRINIQTRNGTPSIIFKNCKFCDGVFIDEAKDLIFENNTYNSSGRLYMQLSFDSFYLQGKAENLKIINTSVYDNNNEASFLKFEVLNDTKIVNSKIKLPIYDKLIITGKGNVEIVDSVIDGCDTYIKGNTITLNKNELNSSYVDIEAKKNINVIDSNIKTYNIVIKGDLVNLINSKITSSSSVYINETKQSSNNNIKKAVIAPKIIYNNIDLSAIDYIKQNNLNKQQLRMVLVEQLKGIKENIKKIKINEIIELNKRR